MVEVSDIQSFFKKADEDDELFSSKAGNAETNARFYHVMQKTGLGDNHFNSDTAKYRNNRFRDACKKNNVIVLFSVVMGNHTHDLVMVQSFEDLWKVYHATNTVTSRYIRRLNPNRFKVPGVKVFGERPTMKAVKSLRHLFYLPFYLMKNVKDCEKQGKSAPYSCFDMYGKGYCYSPYNKDVMEKIFNVSFETYLKALRLSKEDFLRFEDIVISKLQVSKEAEDRLLKIDSNRPWN